MALPRLVISLSTAPVSQDRMPVPAADWYTVMVTRSRALAASNPPVAGSGVGTDGWQMLLRSPMIPLEPAWQKPNSPPMSPMPGTEQIPPEGASGWAGNWTAASPGGAVVRAG